MSAGPGREERGGAGGGAARGLVLALFGAFGWLLAYTASLAALAGVARLGEAPRRLLAGAARAVGAGGGAPAPTLAPVAAVLLLLLGAGGAAVASRRAGEATTLPGRLAADLRRFAGDLRAGLRRAFLEEDREVLWALSLVLAAGVVLRVVHLDQLMRYDEAVTFLEYAAAPLAEGLSRYDLPNNHLLHTMLAHASTSVLGGSPPAVRVPAFVAGVLVVPGVYLVGRSLHDARAGLLAAAAAAASPVLVLFSANARGYSLLVLFFLALVLLARHLERRASATGWALFAALAAAGCHTVPAMLYPLSAVGGWLLLAAATGHTDRDRSRLATETVAALVVAGGLTLVLYSPVFLQSGPEAVFANRFVAPEGWGEFLGAVPGFLASVGEEWHHGLPIGVTVALAVGAGAGLGRTLWRDRGAGLLLLAAALGASLLLVLTRRTPFARVWLYLLPLYLAVAAAGWGELAGLLPGHARDYAVPLVSGLLVLGLVGVERADRTVERWPLTGTLPAAVDVVSALEPRLDPGDAVLATTPSAGPLRYYFERRGISERYMTRPPVPEGDLFVVVNRRHGQSLRSLLGGLRLRLRGPRTQEVVLDADEVTVHAFVYAPP